MDLEKGRKIEDEWISMDLMNKLMKNGMRIWRKNEKERIIRN